MLKSLLLMFLIAAPFTPPVQQPQQPKPWYKVRTAAINKSITDLNFVANDIANANIPEAQKQVWVALLVGVRDSIIVNANDSLLQVK